MSDAHTRVARVLARLRLLLSITVMVLTHYSTSDHNFYSYLLIEQLNNVGSECDQFFPISSAVQQHKRNSLTHVQFFNCNDSSIGLLRPLVPIYDPIDL